MISKSDCVTRCAAVSGVALLPRPGDLVSQILSFGSSSVIEVAITGPQYADVVSYAGKVRQELANVTALRDLDYEEPLHYPTVDIHVDRARWPAGHHRRSCRPGGCFVYRFEPLRLSGLLERPKSGVSYQVQVEVPRALMTSLADIGTVPVADSTGAHPLVNQVASVHLGTVPGELDRQNGLWMIALSANLGGRDLGSASREINRALAEPGHRHAG